MSRTHRQTRTKLYHCWSAMIQRCTNPNDPSWPRYGGRGITVCADWLSFEAFYIDMAPRPEGLTLERIDNDKGYEALNCRWATRSEQQRNKRRSGKGVSWDRQHGKWEAYVHRNGSKRRLGLFDTPEQAAEARRAA